jgi:hypothetical protein
MVAEAYDVSYIVTDFNDSILIPDHLPTYYDEPIQTYHFWFKVTTPEVGEFTVYTWYHVTGYISDDPSIVAQHREYNENYYYTFNATGSFISSMG